MKLVFLLIVVVLVCMGDHYSQVKGTVEVLDSPTNYFPEKHDPMHHPKQRYSRRDKRYTVDEFRNLVKPNSRKQQQIVQGSSHTGQVFPPVKERQNSAIFSKVTDQGNSVSRKQMLPEEFDARKKWPRCKTIAEIQHQGKGGLCWAVVPIAVMNDRTCIKSEGYDNFKYSIQDLLSCCEDCEGTPADVFWHWKHNGIVSEECKSNIACKDVIPKCEQTCQTTRVKYRSDKRKALSIDKIEKEDIQKEIMNNGPVVASMDVYKDFLRHGAGVYRQRSAVRIGSHSVRIIGWGKDEKLHYWLVANSWGQERHDKGVFKIRRGTNECGIEDNVWAGVPYTIPT